MRKAAMFVSTAALASTIACSVSEPSALERKLMTEAKHTITVHGDEDKNPLRATPANIDAGRDAFSHYCVVCHGLDAQNTGVPFAVKMSPPVPPLNSPDVQSYSDGQLKWIIDNGIAPSGMPASKGILSDDEIWSIVVYLRHLPPAGSLGEPCIYTGECPQPKPDAHESKPSKKQ